MQRTISMCDIGLPGFEDEQRLYGDPTPAHTARRWQQQGTMEVIVKAGAGSVWTANSNGVLEVAQRERVEAPVDTTAAGDSFNAAYIAARLLGQTVEAAIAQAQRLAAHVIPHPGAIAPPLPAID